jgi:hypothetical protein
MIAATGTVTGATYDLSLAVPGPTESLDRRIESISWWYWCSKS